MLRALTAVAIFSILWFVVVLALGFHYVNQVSDPNIFGQLYFWGNLCVHRHSLHQEESSMKVGPGLFLGVIVGIVTLMIFAFVFLGWRAP